jgi:hypothetical protein
MVHIPHSVSQSRFLQCFDSCLYLEYVIARIIVYVLYLLFINSSCGNTIPFVI